ncbi:MAG: DUF305 domain-containing protein [Candidatus Peribacteraceae bacterium]|nr:DUF305 domain-containing protein [Candidatus Peribacteraceae bacterium]
MMDTMYGPSMAFAPLLGLLHFVAALAVLAGIVFLLTWAVKHMTQHQLKKWGVILLVGGAVVCALTFGASRHGGSYGGKRVPMMRSENGEMMKMKSVSHDDAMDMSMKGMTMMLEGKIGDEFDAAFLEMMIPHHEGAIEMAELAAKNAGHAELKTMAAEIMKAQQTEIDQMKAWQKAWGLAE